MEIDMYGDRRYERLPCVQFVSISSLKVACLVRCNTVDSPIHHGHGRSNDSSHSTADKLQQAFKPQEGCQDETLRRKCWTKAVTLRVHHATCGGSPLAQHKYHLLSRRRLINVKALPPGMTRRDKVRRLSALPGTTTSMLVSGEGGQQAAGSRAVEQRASGRFKYFGSRVSSSCEGVLVQSEQGIVIVVDDVQCR